MVRRLLCLLLVLLACVVACSVETKDAVGTARSAAVGDPTYDVALWERVAQRPRRFSAGAAFDEAHASMVTFGGAYDFSPSLLTSGSETCVLGDRGFTCPPLGAADHPQPLTQVQTAYDPIRRKVVLFGGQAFGGAANETWTWDGARWHHAPTLTGPPGRTSAAMYWDPDRGSVMLFGGRGNAGVLNDLWSWDGGAWSEIATATRPPPRSHAAVAYHRGKKQLVVVGGSSDRFTSVVDDAWIFDGTTWASVTGPRPPPRWGAKAVYDAARDVVLFFGGEEEFGGERNDAWTWDGAAWSELPSPRPPARSHFHMVYDEERRRVVVYGGSSATVEIDDTWTWDGAAWSEVTTAARPPARADADAVWDPARKRLVVSGGERAGGALDDTWFWDGTSWSELPRFTAPSPRQRAFTAYDEERQRLVVFGGTGPSDALLADTWTWDGARWERKTPATSPSARTEGSAVWDPIRKVVVLFGGFTASGPSNESFAWNGITWTPIPGPRPPARLASSMTFDRARGKVLLVGGIQRYNGDGSPVVLDDSWTYDGTGWTAVTGTRPPARFRGGLVDDPRRARVVLFGGQFTSGNDGTRGDTWLYDGAGWTAVLGAGPSPRSGMQMAFDGERTVLFGGLTIAGGLERFFDDTYTFDGAAWTAVGGASRPLARAFAPTAFDPSQGRVVVTGGVAAADPPADTWYWQGEGWERAVAPSGQPAVGFTTAAYDTARGEIVLHGGRLHGAVVAASVSDETWRLTPFGRACTGACATGTCVDGVCNREPSCGPCERADGVERGVCSRVTNDVDPDTCTNGAFCDGEGTCRGGLGTSCSVTTECASGYCVDGVCCERECSGQCEACNVPGAAGRCQPVRGRPRGARARCLGEDAVPDVCARPACNGVVADRCSGTIGPCAPFACTIEGCTDRCATDAECDADGVCDVGLAICRPRALAAPACDGDHTLVSPTFRQDCAPYRCDQRACRERCASAAECASPFECSKDGACVPPLTNRASVGCSAGGSAPAGGLAVLVLGALFAWRRRRALVMPALVVAACTAAREEPVRSGASALVRDDAARTAVWELVGSPSFRESATMTWDAARRQLVLFGGYAGSAGLRDDTVVYDTFNRWRVRNLPATERPGPRTKAQAFFDPVRMRVVLVGGFTATGASAETWTWDGITWTDATRSPTPGPSGTGRAAWHEAARVGVYFDGTSSWRWDGFGWELLAGGPGRREDAAMVYDPERREILLFGGLDPTRTTRTNETWLFDGTTWRLAPGPMPPARTFGHLAWDPVSRRVLLFGGLGDAGYANDTWTWDGAAWTARPGTSPPARAEAGLVWDAKRARALLHGGRNAGGALGDTWTWDGAAWSSVGSLPARWGSAVAWDPEGERVVLQGGRDAGFLYSDTFTWDGSAWTDVTVRVEPPARFLASSAYDRTRQEILVYGGQGATPSTVLDDTWTFDGTWRNRGSGVVPARTRAVFVHDAKRGETVVFGGHTGFLGAARSDTWIWNGTSWRRGPDAPVALHDAAATYDAARERIVVFGGTTTTASEKRDTTLLWDGTSWTEPALAVKPPARTRGNLVYDAKRQRVLLFGGLSADDETWLWDGTSWARAELAVRPPARTESHLVDVPSAGHVLLYGGLSGVDRSLGDTWTWDGASWSEHRELSPPNRYGASAVYDEDAKAVVLFGGAGLVNAFDDTWTWNGSTWRAATTIAPPVPRTRASMEYDARRHRSVLLGGHVGSDLFDGDPYSGTYTLTLQGTGCATATDCPPGDTCIDGTCCAQASCGTCERCDAPERAGTCLVVARGDDPDTCTGTQACDPLGRCRKALGEGCAGAGECASGFCADGVCCSAPCDGQCEACDVRGALGLCQPVRGKPHGARLACPGADVPRANACDVPACDGVRADACGGVVGPCTPYACTPSGCTDACATEADCDAFGTCDVATKRCRPSPSNGPLCDGAHTLVENNIGMRDCSPYACEGAGCKSRCTSIADCAFPFECDKEGACVSPLGNAAQGGCNAGAGGTSPLGALAVLAYLLRARRRSARRFHMGPTTTLATKRNTSGGAAITKGAAVRASGDDIVSAKLMSTPAGRP